MFNLQKPTTVVKDVNPLQIRKALKKRSTYKMSIVIFESLIEQISYKSCYGMTNLPVQRYLDERTLITTLTSEVCSDKDIEVTKNDDDDIYIFPNETNVFAKFVAVDLKRLAQPYLWSICNVSVSIENGLA